MRRTGWGRSRAPPGECTGYGDSHAADGTAGTSGSTERERRKSPHTYRCDLSTGSNATS